MDFDLTQEQKDIKKAACEFAEGEFDRDLAMELDEKGEFPAKIWKKASELGFIGIHFPEEYGGQGYGALENAIVVEEFCRKDSGIGVSLALADFGSEIILRDGNQEQKERVLPLVAKSKAISTIVFSDVGNGMEGQPVSISARLIGDDYVLNGTEGLVINNILADFFIVLCQLAEESSVGAKLIAFIVERTWNGLKVTPVGKVGLRMISWGRLTLDNIKVPKENVIGQLDRGFYRRQTFYEENCIEIAALALGIAQGAFDRALSYAKQREAFGRPIGQFQAIQHYLANMATEIELARLMTYKAAWLQSHGLPCHVEGNLAKLAASETALYATARGMQIMAGYGYMMEYEMQRYWRDAKLLEFAPINNQVVADSLGEGLGLLGSY